MRLFFMEFDERLRILRDGNVISSDIEALVRRVISRFQDRWQIVLTGENGGRIVTHLAMALMRIKGQEVIAAPQGDLLDEFRNLDSFPQALEIVEDLISFTPMDLPGAERDYLIINVCLILDAQNDS
jgi:hypothetical protein